MLQVPNRWQWAIKDSERSGLLKQPTRRQGLVVVRQRHTQRNMDRAQRMDRLDDGHFYGRADMARQNAQMTGIQLYRQQEEKR